MLMRIQSLAAYEHFEIHWVYTQSTCRTSITESSDSSLPKSTQRALFTGYSRQKLINDATVAWVDLSESPQ
jgi:hypothetical protein